MTLASGDVLVYDGNNWVNSSYTSCTRVVLSRPGPPTQRNGTLDLGDGPFGGTSTGHFVGSGDGTALAINTVSTYLGRLCEFWVGGTEMFWVGSGGMCWVVNFMHGDRPPGSAQPTERARLAGGSCPTVVRR